MQKPAESRIYEFGEFRLDANTRRLYLRASGDAVALTPRAVLLLITLVGSKGRLLTKDELLDRVWAGSLVEEGNLSQTISVLRKALGDNTKKPSYILTMPSRGYQFIAPVIQLEEDNKLDLNSFERFGRRADVNTGAYKAYVLGRAFWNKRTGKSLKQAVEHFEESLRQDPNFGLAYSGLAESHRLLADYYAAAAPGFISVSTAENGGSGTQLAEAYATLGYAQAFYEWDWAEADRSLRKAIELGPSYGTAHQWYADLLVVLGRFDEAHRHFMRAIEIDPGSPAFATGLAGFYYMRRDADRLIRQSKRVIELDPSFAYGHFYLGFGYEFKGMEQEAVDTFAVAATSFGEPVQIGEELQEAYRQSGMSGVWHKRLDQYETRPHLKNYPPYLKSLVPIRLGDKETSLEWLEQAYEQRDRGIVYAKYEPLLEPLRGDARFQDLVHRIGL